MKESIKKKFDSIDQSKIKVESTKELLGKIEKKLNSKTQENVDKAEALLDKFIAQAKAKNADIFVSSKPAPTLTPTQKKNATQVVKNKLDALMDTIANDPLLKDFNNSRRVKGGGKSDPLIDSERKARESGRRVSKKGWKNQYGASNGGRRYYEYRENRIDRKAPNYGSRPWLEDGGMVHPSNSMHEKFMVVEIMEDGSRKVHNKFPDMESAMMFGALKRNFLKSGSQLIIEDENGKQVYRSFKNGGMMADGGMMRKKYDVVYNSYDQETGDLIANNESIYVMANSISEAKNKAMTMLEEGGRDEDFTIVRVSGIMAKGGKIDESTAMVLSQNKEIAHHTEELKEALKKNPEVEPWVIGKIERASTDMSDITHYLDGKTEYADGGYMADGGKVRWQDVFAGDNALVIAENKMGVVIKPYGRRFHLRFPDGSEKTYSAEELEFFKDEEYAKGGYMADDEGNAINLKVGDKVIEYKRPSSDKPKKEYGGQGEIVSINGAMAKVFFESTNYEKFYPLKDLKKMAYGGYMARGGYIVSKADEDGYVYILDADGKKVSDSKIPSDIGYGKVKNKFVVKKAKYDTQLGKNDASDIVERMNSQYAKGGVIEVAIGDKVKSKSGVDGIVYESTGTMFKLEDKYGNKSQKWHSSKDFKASEIIKTTDNKNSTNYTKRRDVKLIVIKNPNKNGSKGYLTIQKKDFLNGLNKFEEGGKLGKDYTYIKRGDVDQVAYYDEKGKTQIDFKPKNGFWVSKKALVDAGMNEAKSESKFEVDDLVYNKKTKTVGIVRIADDKYGEVKTDADGNVNVDDVEIFNPLLYKYQENAQVAPSTKKEIESRDLFRPFKTIKTKSNPIDFGTSSLRKGENGWKAKTSVKDYKGYDWEVTTMKSMRGDLVTTAVGGKTKQHQGYSTFEYVMYQDPNIRLMTSKPARITEKVVEEQHFKALLEFEAKVNEKYAKGGKIENQYEGRTAKDIWDNLSKEQRQHFIYDHQEEIENYRGEEYGELKGKEVIEAYNSDWIKLDKFIKNRFENHVREGEYAKGGKIGFEGLSNKVAKNYEGKKVAPKYRKEYGETYDKAEAKEVGDKVASKVYRQQLSKMEKGGKLPEDLGKYFIKTRSTKVIKMADLIPLRARPTGIANAEKYMKMAYDGEMEKRKPITIYKSQRKYRVLDGNSTYAVAKANGWENIWAEVVKNPNMKNVVKRTDDIFSRAKSIRKEGESWQDALQRAKSMK